MNIKLKVILLLIITLALGIIVGAILNRTLSEKRIRNILSSRRPDFFVTFYEKILEPGSEQSKSVKEILDKHAKSVSEIRADFLDEMQSSFESMNEELDSILTPEQKERLKGRFPGRSPWRGRFRKKRGPDEEFHILKERLGLSEIQASQLQQILEDSRAREGMTRRRREIFVGIIPWIKGQKEKEKAIEKILTEGQKELFKQIKIERLKKIREEIHKIIEMLEKQEFSGF